MTGNILSIGIDSKHPSGFIKRLYANPSLKLYDGLFIAENEFKQNSKLFNALGEKLGLEPIILEAKEVNSYYETAKQHLFLHPESIAKQCEHGIYINSVNLAPITSAEPQFSVIGRDIEYTTGEGLVNCSIINHLLNYTNHYLSEDFAEHYENLFEEFIKDKKNSKFSEYVELRELFLLKKAKNILTEPEFYKIK